MPNGDQIFVLSSRELDRLDLPLQGRYISSPPPSPPPPHPHVYESSYRPSSPSPSHEYNPTDECAIQHPNAPGARTITPLICLPRQDGRRPFLGRLFGHFVPKRHFKTLIFQHVSKGTFQTKDIGAVPEGGKDVAVLTVPCWDSVVACDLGEGVRMT